MRKFLIIWLYNKLDAWSKWECYKSLHCPSMDEVMDEQEKQFNERYK